MTFTEKGESPPHFQKTKSAMSSKQSLLNRLKVQARAKRAGGQSARASAARGSIIGARRANVFGGNRRMMMPAVQRAMGTRAEIKTYDFPVGASTQTNTISTTATFDVLNLPVEGASFYNRIGRKILMRSVHITGMLKTTNNGAGNIAEYLRIMLVYDRQTNGAAPAIADVLADYDQAGNTTTDAYSKMNMNNVERFLILRDHRVQIPDNGVSALERSEAAIMNYDSQANINWFVKLTDLETHFKASAGSVGDIATGALYLITFGPVASATAGYSIIYNARLRYHDL